MAALAISNVNIMNFFIFRIAVAFSPEPRGHHTREIATFPDRSARWPFHRSWSRYAFCCSESRKHQNLSLAMAGLLTYPFLRDALPTDISAVGLLASGITGNYSSGSVRDSHPIPFSSNLIRHRCEPLLALLRCKDTHFYFFIPNSSFFYFLFYLFIATSKSLGSFQLGSLLIYLHKMQFFVQFFILFGISA